VKALKNIKFAMDSSILEDKIEGEWRKLGRAKRAENFENEF
jgi:hypothetical protein